MPDEHPPLARLAALGRRLPAPRRDDRRRGARSSALSDDARCLGYRGRADRSACGASPATKSSGSSAASPTRRCRGSSPAGPALSTRDARTRSGSKRRPTSRRSSASMSRTSSAALIPGQAVSRSHSSRVPAAGSVAPRDRVGGCGLHVVLAGRRLEPLEDAAAAAGHGAIALSCDVRDPKSVAALFAEIDAGFGRLDRPLQQRGRRRTAVAARGHLARRLGVGASRRT